MKSTQSFMKAASFLAFSSLMKGTSVTHAQEIITECPAELQETCALDQNRTCYYYEESSSHTCGYCLNGHVEIYDNCYSIDNIPTEGTTLISDLLQEYLPEYADPNITNDERAQRLVAVSKVVSFWNSRVPPPSFSLGFNLETFLTLEERAGRLGVLSNLTYSPVEGDSEDLRLGNLERFVAKGSNGNVRALQEVPAAIDWHAEGATTQVKNQGICGCCWAVSTAAAIESAMYISDSSRSDDKKVFDGHNLSYQQMISCDEDNSGCDGGNIMLATRYSWVHNDFNNGNMGGLVSSADYPYEDFFGETTPTCDLAGKNSNVFLDAPKMVTSTSDQSSFDERKELHMAAVAQQPITSVLRSGCDLFMNYQGGVITSDSGCECCKTSCIDHAVVIVGYNTTAETPYWKLRNSWGPFWGEEGHFRIAMDDPGCGWGLFGMLAESALPSKVYTSLEDLPEREYPNWWQTAETWEKALVILASILGACCLCGCLGGLWKKHRS